MTVGFRKRFALFLAVLGLSGCSGGSGPSSPGPAEERLLQIGSAYVNATYRLGRPPRNFEEIRPSIVGTFSDDLLRSPRDGEPFVILWDVDCNNPPPAGSSPFVVSGYEKKGVDGKRYVLRFPKSVVLMTDEEFHQAVFPPGHQAPE